MASPITFGGLASGLDTNSIISKLVAVERQPITFLQSSEAAEKNQQSIVNDLSTKLTAVTTALQPLSTQVGVQGRSVTVQGGAPFSASAAGAAAVGQYSVTVNQLAQAQRTYSNSFTAADVAPPLTPGTIGISVGAANANINVDATDSLNSVASKINSSGLPLNASVVYDGSKYRLVVNSQNSGLQNAISFTDPTGLGLAVPANTAVAAQDAQLSIDGIGVHSAQNTVTGIIPGVTLTVTAQSALSTDGVTRVASNLSVASDPGQLEKTLKGVVDAYNAVIGVVNQQFPKPGAKTQLGPETLVGDSTVRELQASLLDIPVTSGGPAGNAFTTLTEIGLTVDRYGTMSLDTGKLETALGQNSAAVTNLLAGTDGTNGLVTKISGVVKGYTDFIDGILPGKVKSLDAQIKAEDDQIARLEVQATAYQSNLQQEFSNLEQLISGYNNQSSSLSLFNNNNTNGTNGSSSSSSLG